MFGVTPRWLISKNLLGECVEQTLCNQAWAKIGYGWAVVMCVLTITAFEFGVDIDFDFGFEFDLQFHVDFDVDFDF